MGSDGFGNLTLQQDYDAGTITVLGDVPDRVLISEALVVAAAAESTPTVTRDGDLLTLHVSPEPLVYRIFGHDDLLDAHQCVLVPPPAHPEESANG